MEKVQEQTHNRFHQQSNRDANDANWVGRDFEEQVRFVFHNFILLIHYSFLKFHHCFLLFSNVLWL